MELDFLIQQENLFLNLNLIKNEELTEFILENLNLCANKWDQIRSKKYIKELPDIRECSDQYLIDMIIPYYIAKWRSQIKDLSRPSHLIPSLVYFESFKDRIIGLELNEFDNIIESRENVINNLIKKIEIHSSLIDLLILSYKNTLYEISILKIEIEECKNDEIRFELLPTNINIESESKRVYQPIVKFFENGLVEFEEIGKIPRSFSTDSCGISLINQERSIDNDYQIALDLFDDIISNESIDLTLIDPLNYIPDNLNDFKTFKNSLIEIYKNNISNDLKLDFIKNLIKSLTLESHCSFIANLKKKLIKKK